MPSDIHNRGHSLFLYASANENSCTNYRSTYPPYTVVYGLCDGPAVTRLVSFCSYCCCCKFRHIIECQCSNEANQHEQQRTELFVVLFISATSATASHEQHTYYSSFAHTGERQIYQKI